MLQGRDGYLWIATLDGLIRFDGVRFTVYNAATSPELPNNRFVSLHETSDGDLWVETEHNLLFRLRHGRFTRFGPGRGLVSLHGVISDRLFAGPGAQHAVVGPDAGGCANPEPTTRILLDRPHASGVQDLGLVGSFVQFR